MTNTPSRSPASIREVLYELSLAKDVPDPELLDEFVRRYPEYATAITDFAVELVVDSLRPERHKEAVVDMASVSPAVSRAMSAFQNAVYANRAAQANPAPIKATHAPAVTDPFARLDRSAFRKPAQDLDVTTVFLCKLRDRQIDFRTMPQGFLQFLGEKLQSTREALAEYFGKEGPPALQPQFFKADQKPEAGPQQSFEEAVRNSGLTETQQRRLLSL